MRKEVPTYMTSYWGLPMFCTPKETKCVEIGQKTLFKILNKNMRKR